MIWALNALRLRGLKFFTAPPQSGRNPDGYRGKGNFHVVGSSLFRYSTEKANLV